ncbi:type II toxin-antitoxin system RelE/ParE family toxin [Tamlana crocina]|uniref:Type II toxin-antitoxin system RelE/ParE family toxin n=1 Tax=Tamlana crocina TaxID=393006 RepID=A0ABX1DH30_9FLAO|nr:type II toxin-antitoxin system RelE/ParE family toxin [Tamlana crocina]NJX15958.1 type II toxin-antitoxin system RelE/ParE family toxin [Tamlana crocina]
MESGYKIFWTNHALKELASTYEYLETNFTKKELNKLSQEIEQVLELISKSPDLFPLSESQGVRKVVIKKFNTLYYRENQATIEILSFFSNRKSPDEREL